MHPIKAFGHQHARSGLIDHTKAAVNLGFGVRQSLSPALRLADRGIPLFTAPDLSAEAGIIVHHEYRCATLDGTDCSRDAGGTAANYDDIEAPLIHRS